MKVVCKKLADLKHVEGNTRVHSAKQIREYIRSIEMFGQFRPMIVDENNVVLAGNGLLQALKEMGRETADCYVMTGLTENKKKKLMLADNKIFQLGEDDQFAFEETLSTLDGDIDIPGYGADVLKNLATDLKDIENAMNPADEKTESKRKSKKRLSADKDICICPHCGMKFNRSEDNAKKSETPLSI